MRRAKQVRHRRQRVPIDVPPGESGSEALADEANEAEKIEVHVHVHRGENPKRSRSSRPAPPVLTGQLFDWQWYGARLKERPPPTSAKRWPLATKCPSCESLVPSSARHCPRCAAPQSLRRFFPAVVALAGLGSLVAVFAVCAHLLGGSVPEHQTPKPLGQWTDDDDYVIVEVPTTPSPFSYNAPAGTASDTPKGR